MIRQLLKQKNLKITPARIAILNIINNFKNPVDAKKIHTLVSKQVKIDLATTYRNLQKLEDVQIIKSVFFKDNKTRYEIFDHHHHLVCTKCNSIEDYNDCKLEMDLKSLLNSYGFKARSHNLEFFGLCKFCQ